MTFSSTTRALYARTVRFTYATFAVPTLYGNLPYPHYTFYPHPSHYLPTVLPHIHCHVLKFEVVARTAPSLLPPHIHTTTTRTTLPAFPHTHTHPRVPPVIQRHYRVLPPALRFFLNMVIHHLLRWRLLRTVMHICDTTWWTLCRFTFTLIFTGTFCNAVLMLRSLPAAVWLDGRTVWWFGGVRTGRVGCTRPHTAVKQCGADTLPFPTTHTFHHHLDTHLPTHGPAHTHPPLPLHPRLQFPPFVFPSCALFVPALLHALYLLPRAVVALYTPHAPPSPPLCFPHYHPHCTPLVMDERRYRVLWLL